MRMPLLRPAFLTLGCVIISSCSNPEAGMGQAGTSPTSATASALPPSLMSQRSIPSASTDYPTGGFGSSSSSVKALPVSSARSSATSTNVVANGGRKKQETVPNVSDGHLPDGSNVDTSGANADAGSTFDNLELVDPGLKAKLAVLRVGSEPTANNLLSVFAGLRNKTGRSLDLEVQTIYKDNLDKPLNDSSWVPLTLKPHESTEYRSAAISSDATDFLVRVRSAVTTGAN